jgi:SAM-dependent methyltransferase
MKLFYGQLAALWPLISPVEDYAAEAAEILGVLRQRAPHARTLLELGSGGGNVAYHLKQAFDCHLTDISEAMLEVSRRLNPNAITSPATCGRWSSAAASIWCSRTMRSTT